MNKLLCVILISCSIPAFSQQDEKALEILQQFEQNIFNSTAINIDFRYIIEDIKEKTEYEQEGKIVLKGDKYKLKLLETSIYFNGTTMWNYLEDVNEVNISNPSEDEMDFFFTNPTKILEIYKDDYKQKYNGSKTIKGEKIHEIVLFPKDLNTGFFKFIVQIPDDASDLRSFKAFGKDGIRYTIVFTNFSFMDAADDAFTFDPGKHPGIQIIDLRE